MTTRKQVSDIQNIFFDSEQVDDADLTQEQAFNNTIHSSTLSNHIGQGVLLETLERALLFDSSLVSGLLDGANIQAQSQPSDTNFGNQLDIELTNSLASGKRHVKLCVIGLNFEGSLQYERFIFKKNEKLISKKHFTQILTLLFNDFVGPAGESFNLGGKLVIHEAKPMALSRDCIMSSQDIEPNLFFRDFFVTTAASLSGLLSAALPLYNIDNLNIKTGGTYQSLLKDDVSSQVGQKFLATTNNIQKITLLLSVENLEPGFETDLAWTGDIIISVYPLQTSIDCPTDIAPNLEIDFSPSNIPLAQISYNYGSLQGRGIILDSVPQPVDFIFSDTPIASGNVIKNTYYATTIKRSGSANKCNILISSGVSNSNDNRLTLFSGNLWVDLPETDLWYQVWTDSAKAADGQAYENGNGIIIPKTAVNKLTGITEDLSFGNFQFVGNDIFRGVITSVTEQSAPIQDQRTGNPVNSRQQFVPQISLLNSLDIANLENVGEPLSLGVIADKNKKVFDTSNIIINSRLHTFSMMHDRLLIRIFDDPSDARHDTDVSSLASYLLNGDLIGAKIVTNANNPTTFYRVADAQLCSMIVGDVDNNGVVDENDIAELNKLVGNSLNIAPPLNTSIITDTVTTTFTNGYTTYEAPFTTASALTFELVNKTTNLIYTSATDGIIVSNPSDPSLGQFTSSLIQFSLVPNIGNYNLVIYSLDPANNGGFIIDALDTLTDVLTIRKTILSQETFLRIMRADLDGDGYISSNDGYILTNYINKLPFQPGFTYPFPGTNPYTNIGTRFNVIELRLEEFVDRTDDYTTATIGRDGYIHVVQDVFIGDGYFAIHNFLTSPVPITITKQFFWEEQFVVSGGDPRPVPSIFSSQSGFNKFDCLRQGEICNLFPTPLPFDPGVVDFFVPNNVVIGDGGEIHRPDGYFYKVDFEVGTIILEIPDGLFNSEKTINLMSDFISDYNDTGLTRTGFPSMRFADCSFVQSDALAKDQLRFSVAVQSFSPNTNGLDIDGYEGVIVDGKLGVAIDYSTGLLTLNFTNLYQDAILPTLTTKVQVNVFLKKGGFNNQTLFVNSSKMQNMLELISVFSGANVGGPSALVELGDDVSGILPILHGGTGLNAAGLPGTVLMSSGGSLSYQFIYNLPGVIAFSTGIPDANKMPKLDGYGLLDPSFYYKNPVYIHGFAGYFENDNSAYLPFGAFSFRFDNYILQGIKDIKLEAILQVLTSGTAEIKLYNITTASYVSLTGMTTTNTSLTFLQSQDLKTLLSTGATNYIYELQLTLTPTFAANPAICEMCRLVITYNNPAAAPPTSNSFNFWPTPP